MYNFLQLGWFASPLAASYAMSGWGLRGLLFFMGLIGIAAIVMPVRVFVLGATARRTGKKRCMAWREVR
jgi:hypothetical protein